MADSNGSTRKGDRRQELIDHTRAVIQALRAVLCGKVDGFGLDGLGVIEFHLDQIVEEIQRPSRRFSIVDERAHQRAETLRRHRENADRSCDAKARDLGSFGRYRLQWGDQEVLAPGNKKQRATRDALLREVEDLYRPGPAPAGEG